MLKDRIRFFRDQKKLSQMKLAELSGLRQSQVSKIERGSRKVTAEELHNLAAALGVTVSALLKAAGE